jgi:hypothetical protein
LVFPVVVGDLEGLPQRAGVAGQRGQHLRRSAGEQRAEQQRKLEGVAAGLEALHLEHALGRKLRALGREQVQRLTDDHFLQRGGELARGQERAVGRDGRCEDQLAGPRLAQRAEQDRDRSAEVRAQGRSERGMNGGAAAADLVAVHEVVVDEQIRVQQLDPHARVQRVLPRAAGGFVAEEDERAAQPLAAAQQVVAQHREGRAEIDGEGFERRGLCVEERAQARLAQASVVGEEGGRGEAQCQTGVLRSESGGAGEPLLYRSAEEISRYLMSLPPTPSPPSSPGSPARGEA